MTAERLAECRARLDGIADLPYEEQAETLEFVHESLTAELDDLRHDREHDRPST